MSPFLTIFSPGSRRWLIRNLVPLAWYHSDRCKLFSGKNPLISNLFSLISNYPIWYQSNRKNITPKLTDIHYIPLNYFYFPFSNTYLWYQYKKSDISNIGLENYFRQNQNSSKIHRFRGFQWYPETKLIFKHWYQTDILISVEINLSSIDISKNYNIKLS